MTVIRDVLVKITTDNTGLTQGLDKAKKGLKDFGLSAAAALGAATGAFVVMTGAAVKSAAEIEKFARLSNTSTREFQRMAAATSTVGIEQEELADILKDVNDRVGDFISTGGGPMADFFERVAPMVGVTADQFRNLSGPQALQLYVDTLQKAGASQQDMTFYLEAMASDATALIPLLRNGGLEMNRLADAAERAGAVLSEQTIAQLTAAKQSLYEIQAAATGFQNELVAAVAPALAEAASALAAMSGEGGPVAEAIDRIAASFGALAEKMASPEFINAATTALTLVIDLAGAGADALIWLTDNFGVVQAAAGALAVAMYALGGPIGWVAGLAAVAATGIASIATASGQAQGAAGGFSTAIADNAAKLVIAANATKAYREELVKLISLQASQAGAAAENLGIKLDRQNEALEKVRREWNGRAAGPFESVPDIGAMEEDARRTLVEYQDAVRLGQQLTGQRQLAEELAGQTSEGVTIPPPGLPPFTKPDTGGGGGAGTDDTQTRLDALREELATESEILAQWYADGQTTLEDALARKMLTEEEYRVERERLEAEHAERMADIDQRAMKAKLDVARTVLGDLSSLMSVENKKLFNIGKAAAIASATIDGWEAATAAWKHGMKIGGPPLAAAFTAASLAKTGAMIASIASQSASGGGGGGQSAGGGTATQAAAPQAPLEVRLTGVTADTILTGANLGTLLKSLSDEAGDRGYRLMVPQ